MNILNYIEKNTITVKSTVTVKDPATASVVTVRGLEDVSITADLKGTAAAVLKSAVEREMSVKTKLSEDRARNSTVVGKANVVASVIAGEEIAPTPPAKKRGGETPAGAGSNGEK